MWRALGLFHSGVWGQRLVSSAGFWLDPSPHMPCSILTGNWSWQEVGMYPYCPPFPSLSSHGDPPLHYSSCRIDCNVYYVPLCSDPALRTCSLCISKPCLGQRLLFTLDEFTVPFLCLRDILSYLLPTTWKAIVISLGSIAALFSWWYRVSSLPVFANSFIRWFSSALYKFCKYQTFKPRSVLLLSDRSQHWI